MADTDCEIALRVCVGMQNFFFMLDQLRLSLGGHGLVSPVPCVIVTAPPGVMDRVALGKFERQNSISEPPYPPIGTAAPARGNAPARVAPACTMGPQKITTRDSGIASCAGRGTSCWPHKKTT